VSFTPRSIGVTIVSLVAMFYAPARALVGAVNARSLHGYWSAEAPWFKALLALGVLLWLAWLIWWAVTIVEEARDRRRRSG
jgi:hypothetical protein